MCYACVNGTDIFQREEREMISILIFMIPICNAALVILFLKSRKHDDEMFKALESVIDYLRDDNKLLSLKLCTLRERFDGHITQGSKLEVSRAAQFAELDGRYLAEMRKKVDSEPTAM